LHHPALMGTAVKLDEGVIKTAGSGDEAGAKFGSGGAEEPCLVWTKGDERPERIDGKTGLSLDTHDGLSKISRRHLFTQYVQCALKENGISFPNSPIRFESAKREASQPYSKARESLISKYGPFAEWVVSDQKLDQWELPVRCTSGRVLTQRNKDIAQGGGVNEDKAAHLSMTKSCYAWACLGGMGFLLFLRFDGPCAFQQLYLRFSALRRSGRW